MSVDRGPVVTAPPGVLGKFPIIAYYGDLKNMLEVFGVISQLLFFLCNRHVPSLGSTLTIERIMWASILRSE